MKVYSTLILTCIISSLIFAKNISAENFSYKVNKNVSLGHFKNDIWMPKELEDVNVGVSARMSFKDLDVKFDADEMVDRVESILQSILKNKRVLLINGAIRFIGKQWAVYQCGSSIEEILTEYPEKIEKLGACIKDGMGDATKLSSGSAVGTASFFEFKTESNPNIFSKVAACISRELGHEYGDGIRRCIDRQTEDNVNTIRDILDWAMKYEYEMKMKALQDMLLAEEEKQSDLVKAVKSYGSVLNPDGSYQDCDEEGCVNKKISWSNFAISIDQDNIIKEYLLEFIEGFSNKSKLLNFKKAKIYGFIFDWLENIIIPSNYFQIEEVCNHIINLEDVEVISKLNISVRDVNDLFLSDNQAVQETSEIIKGVCTTYMEFAKGVMFVKSSEQALPGISSNVQREMWKLAQDKLSSDMNLLKTANQAKRVFGEAKKRSKHLEKLEFDKRIDEAIRKIKEN